MADSLPRIIVRSRYHDDANDAQGARVALWERHAAHPNGEVFVAGQAVVEVAQTPGVNLKLQEGALEIVDRPQGVTVVREGMDVGADPSRSDAGKSQAASPAPRKGASTTVGSSDTPGEGGQPSPATTQA